MPSGGDLPTSASMSASASSDRAPNTSFARSAAPAFELPRKEANVTPSSKDALPPGVRSRLLGGINGLDMHVLEAGFEAKGRPCLLLLHGFPELAYSWRKVMLPLAAEGFHVVAPDQRGYGRTTGWDDAYDGNLDSFSLANLGRDA